MPHYGSLIIEENVEIGFNSVAGRSLYPGDVTLIGAGTKIATDCNIGHDCKIEKNVMVYAGSKIGGWVEIGGGAHIKLNATVKNGLKIGKNAQINMGSVVIKNVPEDYTVFGNPASRIIAPK